MSLSRRYLLDQNFPVKLVRAMADFMPPDLTLVHVPEVDPSMSDWDDRTLILWASAHNFDALVSTNHKMINKPDEVAAMVHTKLTMVFTDRMGHSPLRASGALFLELPTLHDRLTRGSNVFMLRYEHRHPEPAWHYLERIAARHHTTANELWDANRPTPAELAAVRAPGDD